MIANRDPNVTCPSHRPDTCHDCEQLSPEPWRRMWKFEPEVRRWHAIADDGRVMARLPKAAHFLTALGYRPGPEGTPAWYRGSLYLEGDAHDLAAVVADVRRGGEALALRRP
jgi:hypothetical protein